MKFPYTKFTLSALALSFVLLSFGQQNPRDSKYVALRIDKVAFVENQLLQVLDDNNQIVALYDRFNNKSSNVKSVKIFDLEGNLIYTLVPITNRDNFEIHIQNSNKERGLINLQPRLNGMSVKIDSKVDFFNLPYDYEYKAKVGFGSVETNELVYFNGQQVISFDTRGSVFKGISIKPFDIDSEFYNTHQFDTVCWVFIMELFDELQQEANRNRRITRSTN
ncbi:hypothetical protein [Winogradskyella aurantiaca]|uniref:hypothetical protein n=1 Tax=Winogradskyella aurantiaca TaxID=2219558 RepID=UPI001300ACCF|nr:hypothetical protein [Winogradskyella aurantiaca]